MRPEPPLVSECCGVPRDGRRCTHCDGECLGMLPNDYCAERIEACLGAVAACDALLWVIADDGTEAFYKCGGIAIVLREATWDLARALWRLEGV